MTVAEAAIAAYLQTGEFGTVGSTIFVDTKPATPDAVISVFGYAGSPGEHTHDTSGNARPGIQVWVREPKTRPAPPATPLNQCTITWTA